MNKETQSIIKSFEITLNARPWFGRGVFEILGEVDETKAQTKPNGTEHSLLELLWHMNTWAEFCLKQLENVSADEIKEVEARDWQDIDPEIHSWKKGIDELKNIHEKIIAILKTKDDPFLSELVKERKYNYRFMLNGLIQHNIYHLGQVAYVKKLLG
jgi:uncharacterized damage-inducible protein DinB